MTARPGPAAQVRRRVFQAEDRVWVSAGLYVALALTLGLPLLIMALWSFSDGWFPPGLLPQGYTLSHWQELLGDASLVAATFRSLGIAVTVTVLAGIIALPTAWAMARFPFRLKRALELFILAPLIVPGVVMATGLGRLFFGLHLNYTVAGVILVQLVGVLPLMIRLLTASLEGIPDELLHAARSLGAGPVQVALRVVVPLAAPGFMAGGLLSFVSSFEEFDKTFIVGAPLIETLPTKLFFYLNGAGVTFPTAAAVCLLLLLPVLVVFLIVGRIMKDDVMASGMGKL